MNVKRYTSECTTCSYYGKHLEKRTEDMPWPCIECPGGEKYIERGKRKHQVPLRVQLAELEARHNALVKAVKKEHAAFDSLDGAGFQLGPVGSSVWTDHAAARAEVDRLLSGDK